MSALLDHAEAVRAAAQAADARPGADVAPEVMHESGSAVSQVMSFRVPDAEAAALRAAAQRAGVSLADYLRALVRGRREWRP